MAAKKSAVHTARKVIVGILVGIMILVLVAEFGLRWFMGNQMNKQFEDQGAKTSISFGASPLIFGLARGELPEMTLATDSTLKIDGDSVSGQPASKAHVTGLKMGEQPVASHLTMSTTLPDEYLLATLQKGIGEKMGDGQLGNMAVTGLAAHQATSSVDVEFAGGLFSLTLVPQASDGALTFDATNSKLLAWDLPEEVTDTIAKKLSEGMQQSVATDDMRMDSVTINDGSISLTLSGDDVNLSELGKANPADNDEDA